MGEHIAQNLKLIRKLNGLSQAALGKLIGVTGQMVQKYETGQSEISSSTLKELAHVLQVDIRQFFGEGESYADLAEDCEAEPYQVDLDDKTKVLLRAFSQLSQDDKDRLIAMADALSNFKKETS